MVQYVSVAVDVASLGADGPLDYLVPATMEGRVGPGQRVLAPLGRRRVEGVVLREVDEPSVPREKIRPLARLIDAEPMLTPELIDLAPWLAAWCGCSQVEALRAMMPGGVRVRTVDERIREVLWPADAIADGSGDGTGEGPRDGPDADRARPLLARAPRQAHALNVLREHPGRWTAAELARAAGVGPAVVAALVRRGLAVPRLEGAGGAAMPAAATEAAASAQGVSALEADGFRPALTRDQSRALAAIAPAIQGGHHATFLLHGVTGSGKTEVYLRAIELCLAKGRQAVALVPEIALTPQTVARFRERFGDRVAVLHSGLTVRERRRQWRRIIRGEVAVAVGARSAVFAPFPRAGLFIVDEEHETSYKQDEAPRYHAREVASERARRLGAPVILGSATPSLETAVLARRGDIARLALPVRIGGRALPEVQLVDMRAERAAGRRGLFSEPLAAAVDEALAAGEQALFFLNRRGFAPIVLCRDCGRTVDCDACSITLTFHRQTGLLHCHYCDHRRRPPEACAHCGSGNVNYYGVGTERVEALAKERFPGARVLRMDVDTTASRGAHERMYEAFRAGLADILVGTQMVAKGWDIAGVTVVGVVNADTGLHLPDFRAAERTFQLVTQVAGRAGRGDRPGRVFVQTYNPDHYAIQSALRQDCDAFWEREAPLREEAGWPPFRELVRVVVSSPSEGQAEDKANILASALRRMPDVTVLGPAPAPVARVRGRHRWHMALFGAGRAELLAAARRVLEESPSRDPLRVIVDPSPVSML